ncbi:hypothetical protein HGB07_03965 [Candidatus Roizmanbacteria bacterium]|nr:hypothetical protein [Candidatus Roizmanbacteria bacterium]
MHRRTPYIFLIFLTFIALFAIGVQYGRKVEQTNKKIAFVLSITPPPKPTTPPPLEFQNYATKECGIQFLYPKNMKIEHESTGSAEFTANDSFLAFSCVKSATPSVNLSVEQTATDSVQFKNQKLSGEKLSASGREFSSFQIKNTFNGKSIKIIILLRPCYKYGE